MQLRLYHRLRQQVQEDAVGHPATVEAETVGTRVGLASIGTHHAIVGASWVSEACSEGLREQAAVCDADPAPAIDIVLR